MEPACLRHTAVPGTTKLFADFSYHFDRVARFYRHDPHDPASFERAVREIDYPDDRRAAMTRALRSQNGESEALKRFAQPGTVAVVTGQQVGLFSGPAYTVYKALTAARTARQLNERGIPAVPIFWLATEDHDFAEVDHVWTFDREHNPVKLSLNGSASRSAGELQRPVGGIRIEHAPLKELKASLEGFPQAGEVFALVESAYQPGATMGSAFRAFLSRLLEKFGMLFVDPLDPEVRKIGGPMVARALESAADLRARLTERNRELAEAGYHSQVHLEEKTSLFFLLENGARIPLRKKDSEFAAFGDRAAEVSPNALLRPVLQDYLLPTVSYIGGPAELAYLAQAQVLYDALLGRMPVMLARSGFTLIDRRTTKILSRARLTIPEVFVGDFALGERIAHSLIPDSLHRTFDETAESVGRKLDRLAEAVADFDPTLGAALEKSRGKMLYQMEKSRRKIGRETLARDQRAKDEARYLSNALYPHHHLQERLYTILPFLASYGLDLCDRLYEAVQLDCPDHRVMVV